MPRSACVEAGFAVGSIDGALEGRSDACRLDAPPNSAALGQEPHRVHDECPLAFLNPVRCVLEAFEA